MNWDKFNWNEVTKSKQVKELLIEIYKLEEEVKKLDSEALLRYQLEIIKNIK